MTIGKILVGLSGGVDSAISAYLLQQAGYDVAAGFMKNYVTEDESCPTREDRDAAIAVAAYLGIRTFIIFDFRAEYRERIIEYIYRGYRAGITPNPDVLCNSEIKFALFADRARELGFDAVATGHYARIEPRTDGRYALLKGTDETKDQSYFLSGLSQEQLAFARFPIGHLCKTEVRDLAKKINLPNAERPDSQGLCFIGRVSMRDFLAREIPSCEGEIRDTSGRVLGTHTGVASYTIGQRRGIAVGGWPALYVIAKDMTHNILIVGTAREAGLYRRAFTVADWHSIGSIDPIPRDVSVKIRYRQANQIATMQDLGDGRVAFTCENMQRAVTPGQIAVAYSDDEVIGSGIIEEPESTHE